MGSWPIEARTWFRDVEFEGVRLTSTSAFVAQHVGRRIYVESFLVMLGLGASWLLNGEFLK